MKLSEFTDAEIEHIIQEWVSFARTILPVAKDLSEEGLRDHARVLLQAMVKDMRALQSEQAQLEKSQGNLPDNAPEITKTARAHAQHRFSQGFTLDQMVSEYRALRASVIRRWAEQHEGGERDMLNELTRFGETMDQGLTESVSWYDSNALASRNLLLGVLGHDMRSPLGTARMSAQFLLATKGLDGEQTTAVVRILRATEKMRTMMSDMLDFTQTAFGVKLPIARLAINVGQVGHEVVAELEALHPGRTIDFESAGELRGEWDATRVGQMMSNLIANALQHGDRSTPVRVTVKGDAEGVTVKVHNEGLPLSAATRRTLFEPLKQPVEPGSDRHSGSSGLGLGLYIAREVAVAHGGTLDVVSTELEGTTFSARLPHRPPTDSRALND